MQRLFYGGTNMYLGVDLGSTNIKAAIYDGSMQLVGQQSRPVEYLRENGFVEFDAERYYNELAALIAQLTRDCGVSKIRQIAFTGQAESLVCVDAEGRAYPASNMAASVLDALRLSFAEAGGEEVTGFRVRALSRRGRSEGSAVLTLCDLSVDTSAQKVTRGGKPIALTGREYALLEYLMRNQGAVLSRERIEQNIFNYDYEGASNMVDVYIRYLRKKIDEGFSPKLIHTVRGAGYVLREEA